MRGERARALVVVMLSELVPGRARTAGGAAVEMALKLPASQRSNVDHHVDTGEARDSPEHCGYLPCGPSAACLQLGRNPSRGIVTFDHIGASMMTVFQVRHHA